MTRSCSLAISGVTAWAIAPALALMLAACGSSRPPPPAPVIVSPPPPANSTAAVAPETPAPPGCREYEVTLEKLSSCMSADGRDALQETLGVMRRMWAQPNMTPETAKLLGEDCRAASAKAHQSILELCK